MPSEIETLYSDMARRYDSSGMYVSMFHAAKRLGDKELQAKALENEAAKFSLFGFDERSRLFLNLTKERMDKGSLEDIDIPQIELSIIGVTAKRLAAYYGNAKESFNKASGISALRHAKRLVSGMYAMSRLDSLYDNVSSGWPFPFADGPDKNKYAGRDYFIVENFDYIDSVCPRIADIVKSFDLAMEKKTLQKIRPMSELLKKSEVDESHIEKFVSAIPRLIGNAMSDSRHLVDVLSDLGEDGRNEVMRTIGGTEGPITRMHCLYLFVENLEGIAERRDIQRAEDIIESMHLMATWRSSDLHSFERLLAVSKPRKSHGRQTNLDKYLKLRRD